MLITIDPVHLKREKPSSTIEVKGFRVLILSEKA
tara:strand:- start:5200 stop:5301 length:102 start_codon:yes stop_codon:yes gene_type:complete